MVSSNTSSIRTLVHKLERGVERLTDMMRDNTSEAVEMAAREERWANSADYSARKDSVNV